MNKKSLFGIVFLLFAVVGVIFALRDLNDARAGGGYAVLPILVFVTLPSLIIGIWFMVKSRKASVSGLGESTGNNYTKLITLLLLATTVMNVIFTYRKIDGVWLVFNAILLIICALLLLKRQLGIILLRGISVLGILLSAVWGLSIPVSGSARTFHLMSQYLADNGLYLIILGTPLWIIFLLYTFSSSAKTLKTS
mgnify:CR=1 FL=1